MWRLWVLLSGLPLGVLGALAAPAPSAPALLILPALAAGAALFGAAAWIAGSRPDDRGLPSRLAGATGFAWFAAPGVAATLVDLPPGAAVTALLAVAGVGGGFLAAARRRGSRTGPLGWLARAALGAGLGALLPVALALAQAGLGPRYPALARVPHGVAGPPGEASVLCSMRVLGTRTLLDRGAHPRLDASGKQLWFDARSASGRRQVYRLEREDGALVCWTCAEAGENRRPTPSGAGVAFETDRHASWRHPLNTEIHLAAAQGPGPSLPSRRLTFDPRADRAPGLVGEGKQLVWTRLRGGRIELVAAAIRSGHGGLLLDRPLVLAVSGSAWMEPLAIRDDALLVLGLGNPWGPRRAVRFAPAAGELDTLDPRGVRAAGLRASAPGALLAVSPSSSFLGALPDGLGFLLGRLALARSVRPPGPRSETFLYAAAPARPLAEIRLEPSDAGWGAPTGIALEPDGSGFVLGQRRSGRAGPQERLLEVWLDCPGTGGKPD